MDHLVQLLLPISDNAGQAFAPELYDEVRHELTRRFHGVTAHVRAPARGVWSEPGGDAQHEDVVLLEVMVDRLDRCWWHDYRRQLEARFHQKELVVRAFPIDKL